MRSKCPVCSNHAMDVYHYYYFLCVPSSGKPSLTQVRLLSCAYQHAST